ncbi:hypothetical protein AXG93_3506s1260 [Marchantia polymorpha subsp. ruderalis]|uniref:Aminotransferase class I/classII large domain-containing protein n=1 Tax=Marchantia polymorpha subsp. ruderalis TaxID=1480154 RepID=A0A176VMA4_MARPO|nr:hypothetical protein AXG93_3506s1260 [Marchantia polymorpha subsp. ruderalis]
MASPGFERVWGAWLDQALLDLGRLQLNRKLLSINSSVHSARDGCSKLRVENLGSLENVETFEALGPWDRETVDMTVSQSDFTEWLGGDSSTGQRVCVDFVKSNDSPSSESTSSKSNHSLRLFSGNDYLGLSAHPSVRLAAARECLLCPTGFAANMAVMTALSSVLKGTLSAKGGAFAIFSDSLNHASIIDGVRLAQKTGYAEVYQYRHSDMVHLEKLLLECKLQRKVVVTDSLFSMDGDFAPMTELASLRRKYNFLLVVDDAHGTLVCGENGGGVAEAFGVEHDVDIYVGTLSKAFGCHGGFIATSRKWKQWIQSRGRSFIFSTALPIPVVTAAYAAIVVAREEKWRQHVLWERVRQLSAGIGVDLVSPIAPIIIGSADEAVLASRELLQAGFHVLAIRPPTVPEGSSRLRITLSSSHTEADVAALLDALPSWIKERAKTRPSLSISSSCRWQPSVLTERLGLLEPFSSRGSKQYNREAGLSRL